MKGYPFLLVFFCIFVLVSLVVIASTEDSFEVSSVEDLLSIKDDLEGHYILVDNISLEGVSWEPIRDFKGVFDGNNNSISGLNIDIDDMSHDFIEVVLNSHEKKLGFFSSIKNAQVHNLNLVDVVIVGGEEVGGLAGVAEDSVISNVHVSGSIDSDKFIGGLIGLSENSVVKESSFNGSIIGEQVIGGLIGQSSSGCEILDSSVFSLVSQEITFLEARTSSSFDVPFRGFSAEGYDYRVNDFVGLGQDDCSIEGSLSNMTISLLK